MQGQECFDERIGGIGRGIEHISGDDDADVLRLRPLSFTLERAHQLLEDQQLRLMALPQVQVRQVDHERHRFELLSRPAP